MKKININPTILINLISALLILGLVSAITPLLNIEMPSRTDAPFAIYLILLPILMVLAIRMVHIELIMALIITSTILLWTPFFNSPIPNLIKILFFIPVLISVRHLKLGSLSFWLVMAIFFYTMGTLVGIFILLFFSVLRFVYLLIKENLKIFKEMGFLNTFLYSGKALLIWLPLLAMVLPGAIAVQKTQDFLLSQFYAYSFVMDEDHDNDFNDLPIDIKRDIDASLQEMAAKLITEFDRVKDRVKSEFTPSVRIPARKVNTLPYAMPFMSNKSTMFPSVKLAVNNPVVVQPAPQESRKNIMDFDLWSYKRMALDKFDETIPPAYTFITLGSPPDMGDWLKFWNSSKNIKRKVEYEAKKAFKNLYDEQRYIARSALSKKLDKEILKIEKQREKLARTVHEETDQLYKTTVATVEKITANINYTQKKLVDTSFLAWRIYLSIMDLLFLYLILRSYSYVFTRVAIKKKSGATISLADENMSDAKGTVSLKGQEYMIPIASDEIFYYVRTLEPVGCPPRIAIPSVSTAVVKRIKNKSYILNKVDMTKNHSAVYFKTISSNQFVEWDLAEGEEIIFDYKHLVGFSNTVKLKKLISFKMTSTLMGGFKHNIARGPGKIIFLTKGKPLVNTEESGDISMSPEQLIVWNRNAHFEIISENNPVDLLFSGYYIKLCDKHQLIIDCDDKGKPKTGLVRFVKSFILPF